MTACVYWQTHDASPGEREDIADTQALQYYQEIQQAGWDLFATLRTIRLNEHEAETLYIRLLYLHRVMPGIAQVG